MPLTSYAPCEPGWGQQATRRTALSSCSSRARKWVPLTACTPADATATALCWSQIQRCGTAMLAVHGHASDECNMLCRRARHPALRSHVVAWGSSSPTMTPAVGPHDDPHTRTLHLSCCGVLAGAPHALGHGHAQGVSLGDPLAGDLPLGSDLPLGLPLERRAQWREWGGPGLQGRSQGGRGAWEAAHAAFQALQAAHPAQAAHHRQQLPAGALC